MNPHQRALIIGASQGIGLAVVQQLLQQGWEVCATWRSTRAAVQHERLRWLPLDITDAEQREQLLQQLNGEHFDAVLINAGMLGPREQVLRDADEAVLSQLFLTNAVAPVRMAERLLPLLRDERSVMALTTSQLASLTENPQATLPFYAASKAALNMLSRALAGQMAAQGTTLLSLHPGWVKTAMGGEEADITAEQSASGLVTQLQRFRGQGGHHFIDYRGQTLAW